MNKLLLYFAFFGILVSLSCARAPLRDKYGVLRKAEVIQIQDDLNLQGFQKAVEVQLRYWESRRPSESIEFGPRILFADDFVRAYRVLLKVVKETPQSTLNFLKEHFESFEVYGNEEWSQVFITGYFEPILEGSKKPTAKYSQALYKIPKDLVSVDMAAFAETFPHWKPFEDWISEQKSPPGWMRGRYIPVEESPLGMPLIRPYYTREEMDSAKVLKGKNLEYVYVDPIEAFFLQIQGSGKIHLQNGELLRLGYAAQNGHPYVPIGKFLKDKIPMEQMSLQSIQAYMRKEMTSAAQQELMNKNPSYVFFQELKGEALTAMGTEAVGGRTIATDTKYFPKGTLALLEFEKPILRTADGSSQFVTQRRLVFDQDTGGAIRGPGRVDLFCGSGDEAREMAGVMKNKGRLWYLLPKERQSAFLL